jgi:Flp pilus assembly protein TadG
MKRGSAEDGSVLVLGIGLIGVLLVAISVVTDASMAFHQRSVLQARADAAVLAGSQGIDLTTYYLRGATTATTLVPAYAQSLARRQIEQAQGDDTIDGLEVVALTASPTTVTAVLQAPIRTAFWPIEATITVESAGRLDYVG